MDTSSDASGKDIRPRITEPYDGGNIVLNAEKNIVLSPVDFPSLRRHTGKRIIVTDGTTLLGADDKAGVAEILSAAELLLRSDRPHGAIRIGFTPDEDRPRRGPVRREGLWRGLCLHGGRRHAGRAGI